MTGNNFNKRNKVSMEEWKGIVDKLRSHNRNISMDKENNNSYNPFQRTVKNNKSNNKIQFELDDPIKCSK